MYLFLTTVSQTSDESEFESNDAAADDESFRQRLFANKKRKECPKGESGRKTLWSDSLVGDFVDIIISNDYYKSKLILT